MHFFINFRNLDNNKLTLKFRVYNNKISRKWFKALQTQVQSDNQICEPDRFYNFPNEEWSESKIIDELNSCIDIINSNESIIHHRAFVGMDQEQLNHLHHYFENLRGGILSPTDFWNSANEKIRSALERYNIIIHRAEDYYHNQKIINSSPRIVCRFKNRPRFRLSEKDFHKFTLLTKPGEIYINYCEVGKSLFDVFRDEDEIVGEDNIRPLQFYSADFKICFGNNLNESKILSFWLMKVVFLLK